MKVPSLRTWEIVTVEEIECTLLRIASLQSTSSSAVRSISNHFAPLDIIESLQGIYERLDGRDAKWLTRYIMKDYRAIFLPDSWEMEAGRLGMPNVASITLNMFSKHPPGATMLQGTRIIKAHPWPQNRKPISPSGLQLGENGWPRRTILRSREASPISQPISFAKGVLTPAVAESNTTTGTALPFSCLHGSMANNTLSTSCNCTRNACESVLNNRQSPNAEEPDAVRTTSSQNDLPSSVTIQKPASNQRSVLSPMSSNVSRNRQRATAHSLSMKVPAHAQKLLSSAGTGVCQLSKDKSCPFSRCIFIPAPCVAAMSRVSTELLAWHGAMFAKSPKLLICPDFPVFCPKTHMRYRKIILINTHNRVKTVEFLREVQNLKLQVKVPKGKRKRRREHVWTKEWLEVYDWRLLEAVGKIDQGKIYDYDVWKRNFIGTI